MLLCASWNFNNKVPSTEMFPSLKMNYSVLIQVICLSLINMDWTSDSGLYTWSWEHIYIHLKSWWKIIWSAESSTPICFIIITRFIVMSPLLNYPYLGIMIQSNRSVAKCRLICWYIWWKNWIFFRLWCRTSKNKRKLTHIPQDWNFLIIIIFNLFASNLWLCQLESL